MQWMRSYQAPKDADFNMTLFKAQTLLPAYQGSNDKTNHWRTRHGVKIQTYEIPGDHFSLHIEPNVHILADRLLSCLNTKTRHLV